MAHGSPVEQLAYDVIIHMVEVWIHYKQRVQETLVLYMTI